MDVLLTGRGLGDVGEGEVVFNEPSVDSQGGLSFLCSLFRGGDEYLSGLPRITPHGRSSRDMIKHTSTV
jgi:hypothetical protein